MLLDLQAARAVAAARLFERAVNDPGPWAIRIGEQTQPAVRIRTSTGVRFIAHFDHGADPAEEVMWLVLRGEEVASREVHPITDAFSIEWRFWNDVEVSRV